VFPWRMQAWQGLEQIEEEAGFSACWNDSRKVSPGISFSPGEPPACLPTRQRFRHSCPIKTNSYGDSMNRRSFLKSANAAGLAIALPSSTFAAAEKKPATAASPNPNTILLKDYRPQSIFKVPVSHIARAKYPVIDMHSHPYPKNE